MAKRKPLYLIDASVYIFRAYFSLPETMVDAAGKPVNAVYGFAGFLNKLIALSNGNHFAVAFDESLTSSFRNDFYPDYKANRELPPAELEAQLKSCQELTRVLGLASFVSNRYEADDLIGTVAAKMRPKGFRMVFVSGDKDLAQLLRGGDVFWDFARDERLTAAGIKDRFGVKPEQIVDLLALAGDSVDNIPGVPGIGPKTAGELLRRFGSLDGIYGGLAKIHALGLRGARRIQQLLQDHREQAYLSQRLARIADNAPIRCPASVLARKPPKAKQLADLCDRLNFGSHLRTRLAGL